MRNNWFGRGPNAYDDEDDAHCFDAAKKLIVSIDRISASLTSTDPSQSLLSETLCVLKDSLRKICALPERIRSRLKSSELEPILTDIASILVNAEEVTTCSVQMGQDVASRVRRQGDDKAKHLLTLSQHFCQKLDKMRLDVLLSVPTLRLSSGHHHIFHCRAVLYTDKRREENVPEFVPHVDSPWIDIKRIRKWLDYCDCHHHGHCSPSSKDRNIFKERPQYLIDVDRMCLVIAEVEARYLALSYVWGTGAPFQALTDNIDDLLKPRSLERFFTEHASRCNSPTLPRTIRDVIKLVQMLDERYVWIDSLCIVQDDARHKQDHVRAMGSIYANAYATIAAAAGTAFQGLRGIEGVTPPIERRLILNERVDDLKSELESRRPALGFESDFLDDSSISKRKVLRTTIRLRRRLIQRSHWNQRAWTFQEQVFSRRVIVLGQHEASWECHCAVWFEFSGPAGKRCSDTHDSVARGFDFGGPRLDLKDLFRHVRAYNTRRLSYPEDVLDAFAGIISTLERAMQEEFVAGLPLRALDSALLWTNDSLLSKRRPKTAAATKRMPPSWSWAAWEGEIRDQDFYLLQIESVVPLVWWLYREHPAGPTVRIHPPEHVEDLIDPACDTAEEAKAVSSLLLETRMPHVLFSRPLRNFLPASAITDDFTLKMHTYDKFGVQVVTEGSITSCERIANFDPDHDRCEVVAISMRGEWFFGPVYNVLWITWDGPVAYRRGVGYVSKSLWDTYAAPDDRVNLLLG